MWSLEFEIRGKSSIPHQSQHKQGSFSLRISSHLVTLTEEILNRNFTFCAVNQVLILIQS